MEMKNKNFSTKFAGRNLTIKISNTSPFSNAGCWVFYGNTTVMVHTVMSKQQRQDIDFFPLSVEYEEKFYAAGKIPGSYLKRESKPSENAILTARCIDRSIRPFFPKDFRNDVSVVATVLSTDVDNSPEVCAIIGAAVCLSISDIPWNGPVVGVNVGIIDDEIVLNPNIDQRSNSDLNLTVSANFNKIAMIEAQANEVSEEKMLECIKVAHEEIKNILTFINEIKSEIGKQKIEYDKIEYPEEIVDYVKDNYNEKIKNAIVTCDKSKRDEKIQIIVNEIYEKYQDVFEDVSLNMILGIVSSIQKQIVRNWILTEGKRVDNRSLDEIRPISCDVDFIPLVHGCGIFKRGQTQTMSVVTLGSLSDEQKLDGLDEKISKRYIHHYNFPGYSVGEVRPNRAPGRREIGHGALAEKALNPVIPSIEEFPYSIRVVSETISSNGSTSQASICSSSLALMDAGVPIKAIVAGISCGLVTDENEDYVTMLDIQGIEDFFGDMDFKVGGTTKGITAIQVDVKIDGLSHDIIKEVFEKTRKARVHIINDIISPVIAFPKSTVKESAPKIEQIEIPASKIKDVIGTNGKIIQKISADHNVKIEIQEYGKTYISGLNLKNIKNAKKVIKTIITNPKIGEVVTGVVSRIMPFGAFIEIAPGKEGLLHISKLDYNKVASVQDVLKIGDSVIVKIIEIDDQGRINLSRKDALSSL